MRQKENTGTNAQAALEYLMTYGWALVLIVTIASVLFVFTTGGYSKNQCQTISKSFFCKGVYADGDTVILKLQNASARKITINPFTDISFDGKTGYATVIYGGEHQFDEVTIPAGETFEIKGNGMALAKILSFTYTEVETGYTKTATVNLTTDAPPTTEISNDGVDNDKDELIDCADPNVANAQCVYVLEATSVNATSTTATAHFVNSTGTDLLFLNYKLIFNVISYAPTATITEDSQGTTKLLEPGLNVINVQTSTPTSFDGGTSWDIQLTSGSNFSISDKPKMVITVTP